MKPMLQSVFDSVGDVHLVNSSAIARIFPQGGTTSTGSVLVSVELVSGSVIVMDSGCAPMKYDASYEEAIGRALHEVASWFGLDVVE